MSKRFREVMERMKKPEYRADSLRADIAQPRPVAELLESNLHAIESLVSLDAYDTRCNPNQIHTARYEARQSALVLRERLNLLQGV